MKYIGAILACIVAHSSLAATLDARNNYPATGHGYVTPFSGQPDVYEERFNTNTALTGCVLMQKGMIRYGPQHVDDPTLASSATAGNLWITTGTARGLRIPPGSNAASQAAGMPDIDTSCYASGPAVAANSPQSQFTSGVGYPIQIRHNSAGLPVQYLGIYLGSIDEYNRIGLFTANETPIIIPGLSGPDGYFYGDQLVKFLGVPLYSSQYLNFYFSIAENFDHIEVDTDGGGRYPAGRAIEFDNLAFAFHSPTGSFRTQNISYTTTDDRTDMPVNIMSVAGASDSSGGAPFSLVSLGTPSLGSVTFTSNGSMDYSIGVDGTDSFYYILQNTRGVQTAGMVTILVKPGNSGNPKCGKAFC